MLGTNIIIVYPLENAKLYERISYNDAIITQFPFNRTGDKQSLPIRNSIVAEMTLGTVVVEANMDTDNNRQLFGVSDRIDSPQRRSYHNITRNETLCAKKDKILAHFKDLFPNRVPCQTDNTPYHVDVSHQNEQTVMDILETIQKSIEIIRQQ